MGDPDLVVVGGGIAGGAFATVMARAGANVLLLERQAEYRDRVRGELMWPWGVAEVQRLGLEDILRRAGANVADRFESHDEGHGADAPVVRVDLSAQVVDAPGSINLFHPTATRALADAATAAGGRVVVGVHMVMIGTAPPTVAWTDGDGQHEVRCGLIVGADGRSSTVRAQAGIELHKDPTAHLATGLLVEGLEAVDDRTDLVARGNDLLFLSFPQGGGRARVYLCMPTGQRDRFAGADAAERFLKAAMLVPSLPDPERWAAATPAGPCATFTCEDTWVDRPYANGVVLIGDAGGHNNPLIGQGLSLAVRDAGVLADLLRTEGSRTPAVLEAYGVERTERLRRARISCLIDAWANDGFHVQDPQERSRRYERTHGDEVLAALMDAQWRGFDAVPWTPSDDEAHERLFANA
jgi:2-polyprenyl-6-methoxyphenol hydroxylase-like FAD-dependent oxidoreductase